MNRKIENFTGRFRQILNNIDVLSNDIQEAISNQSCKNEFELKQLLNIQQKLLKLRGF